MACLNACSSDDEDAGSVLAVIKVAGMVVVLLAVSPLHQAPLASSANTYCNQTGSPERLNRDWTKQMQLNPLMKACGENTPLHTNWQCENEQFDGGRFVK